MPLRFFTQNIKKKKKMQSLRLVRNNQNDAFKMLMKADEKFNIFVHLFFRFFTSLVLVKYIDNEKQKIDFTVQLQINQKAL